MRTSRSRTIGVLVGVLILATLLAPLSPGAASAAAPGDEPFATVDRRAQRPPAAELDRLLTTATARGHVDVAVGLPLVFTPEGALTARQKSTQRAAIATAAKALTDSLAGTGFTVLRAYDSIPHVALRLPPAAVRALSGSARVASVRESVTAELHLAQSGSIVEAPEAQGLSRTGTGQYVAVIDSGVARNHEFFGSPAGSRVTDEACFATVCPNGTTGPNAAAPCALAVCDHGTHVAGIAAGAQYCASPCAKALGAGLGVGMAPSAKIIAIQVISDICAPNGCAAAHQYDIDAALVHVLNLAATRPVAAVNLSLGTGSVRYPDCDGLFQATTDAIDNLRSARVATVISSGNSGSAQGVSWPACISSAITVGSTTKTGAVSSFSNTSSQVELLAPGGDATVAGGITSSISPSGYGSKSGTSMAAPHVAGAFTVLREVALLQSGQPSSVGVVLQSLQLTGKPVTAGSLTLPQIRILAASTRFKDTGFQQSVNSAPLPGGGMVSAGTGLLSGSGSFTLTLPSGTVPVVAYLYWTTLGGPDTTASLLRPDGVTVPMGGALRGASADTCPSVFNQAQPLRTYRATVSTSNVMNGVYSVSGIGGGGIVTHGASLVVVYKAQTFTAATPKTKVHLRDGAITVALYSGKADLFPVPVPANVSVQSAEVHLGVANGTPGGYDRTRLASQFLGTNDLDGGTTARWNDKTYSLYPSELPAPGQTYSLSRGVYMEANTPECLGWAYQGLTFTYT